MYLAPNVCDWSVEMNVPTISERISAVAAVRTILHRGLGAYLQSRILMNLKIIMHSDSASPDGDL